MSSTACGLHEDDFDDGTQPMPPTPSPGTCGNSGDGACNGSGACHNTSTGTTKPGSCKQQRPQGSWARAAVTLGEETVPAGAAPQQATCVKCKAVPGVVNVRHGEAVCKDCLDASVVHKVRASKAKGAFLPHDRVLVAISGGCSSLALLSCLLEIRSLRPDKKEKGKVPLDILPVHIQEGSVWGCSDEQLSAHEAELRAAVAATGCPTPLLVVPLAAVTDTARTHAASSLENGAERAQHSAADTSRRELPTDGQPQGSGGPLGTVEVPAEQQAALQGLVQGVSDMTGREDLVCHLRERLLLDTARRLGYTKVARGDTANTLAIRVISDTAKGRGFSLPADIALADARHGPGAPAVVLPCRDITAKETVWFCRGRNIPGPVVLPVLPPPDLDPRRSINQLAEGFVSGIQANLPSIMFTILRTGGALKPFPFSDMDTANQLCGSAEVAAAAAQRHAKRHTQAAPSEGTHITPSDGGATKQGVADRHTLEAVGHTGSSKQSVTAGHTGEAVGGGQVALCSLCSAPLPAQEALSQGGESARTADSAQQGNSTLTAALAATCCHSCRGQILHSLLRKKTGSQGSAESSSAEDRPAVPAFMLRPSSVHGQV